MKAAVWLAWLECPPTPSAVRRIGADSRGALTLPLLVMVTASALFGLGTLGLMRHWRHLTELQLRLDRCVGGVALDLRRTLDRIEAGNTRIRALRASQAAVAVASLGEASGSLVPLMEAEVAHQEFELVRWQTRRIHWLLQRGCDGERDLPTPLPEMSWTRLPADETGPQPLSWSAGAPTQLRLTLAHSPRGAAAVVETRDTEMGGSILGNSWKATWAVPGEAGTGLLRASRD